MRVLVRILVALILCVVVLAAGLLMLPGDKIAQVAVDQIKAQTGRSVTLKGETQVSYYPVLGVSTGSIEIANADWSDAGPLMVADSLKIGVDLASLIGGEIKITGLEAVNPNLLLERAKDGRVNWDLGVEGVATTTPAAASKSNPLALSLNRALVSGGKLRFLDHQVGGETRVDDLAIDLRWPEYRGAASFDLSARPQGASLLSVSGEVSQLANLIENGSSPGKFTAKADGGSASFTGTISAPLRLEGAVKLQFSNTSAFLASLGVKGIEVPQGLGRAASAEADLSLSEKMVLSLKNLRLTLDQNSLSGAAQVDLGATPPNVTATLAAGTLDFSGLAGGGAGGGGSSASAGGWSKSPIDASALGSFNGKVDISAKGLNVAGLTFGATSASAAVDNSRAVVTLNRLAGYAGTITGQVVANNRKGLSVGGSVKASGMEMQTLLRDLAGVDRFTGQGEAQLEFLGSGNSTHAIMNSISGKGAVSMGRGTIKGFDLDSLMRKGLATGGTTVFDSLSASFTMDKGNLTNNDLLLKLPVISATGKGRVGLGARDIDYLFTPKTASAESTGGVVIPVRIRGSWDNPKIWPDMDEAIDLNLKEEKKAVQKKAEEEVKKKLGIETQEGESLEDAAKKKLEQEVLKGLGKLFK
ncbi:AsmA family protein [Thioclava sp. A2]|uniref:AsmA family protein n=1 Tax=Thioclava sp. FCG-A2 TaxID=3080562 RepID=UPI002952D46B|nr:AsmA family protein [Thioclava sp. A2]MDV7270825.1 AsmA family protein [Thioclava sp. A2]